MRRPQFSIKTLFWLTLCVAMFLGGMTAQHRLTGLQATEREKKLEATISVLDKQMRSERQAIRALDDELFALKLEKFERGRPPDNLGPHAIYDRTRNRRSLLDTGQTTASGLPSQPGESAYIDLSPENTE